MRMTLTERCTVYQEEPAAADPSRDAVRGELAVSLPLCHGHEVATRIRYELLGPSDAPLLIVAGGISAGRHVVSSGEFPEPGWWEVQREALASPHFRLLAIDWLGADGTIDLPIDPADQADALAQVLTALGVARAAGFVGASYGGMVGMHFAARYADRLGALLAISAAARSHPYSSACRALQRQAVSLGEAGGDPEAGVALARAMAMLTYRTPTEFGERFVAEPAVEDGRVRVSAQEYLAFQGEKHRRRMSAPAYRRLSESIDLHVMDPAKIGIPLTLAAVDQDGLVPAEDVRALAGAVSGARLYLIQSRYGHDAFLKEQAQVAKIISQFLSSLEPRS